MTPTTRLADQDARDRISSALDETLVVEAAAGTGKTTELVKRIVRLITTGKAAITGIAAVTFTEKAAGELRLRLREELEVARQGEAGSRPAAARLDAALASLEDAQVGTIHGFCADLLKERPIEAGLDPLFAVLTELQARRCFDEAFSAWLQQALEHAPEGVRRSLRRSSQFGSKGDGNADGPVDRLRAAAWQLAEWRDFSAPWTRPAFLRDAAVDTVAAEVHAFATLTAQASRAGDLLFRDTAAARHASDELRILLSPAAGEPPDHDGAEALLIDLKHDYGFRRPRKGGSSTSYGPGVARADVQAAHARLLQSLDTFAADADADLAAVLRDELTGPIERYAELKARAGAVDFLDLLLRTRNLLRDDDAVRREFQERLQCVLVDEFQDTDPLQAEVLLLLTADDPAERDWRRVRPEPGKLFVVGDPKQSIYRFRRADVAVYHQVCGQLAAQGAQRLLLTTSFRSVPNIQQAINTAFAPLMTGDRDTLQAEYVPLTPAPWRMPSPQQPSVVALPVPRPYGATKVTIGAIESSLPDAIGAFVEWVVNRSGWVVSERRGGGGTVPVEARHICVLFRRFVKFGSDVTRPYIDALEARGVKHLLVGGRAFHDREEIETLRSALAAVEWPDDELSVFATLRGSFFAIADEDLFEYRHLPGVRGFHPMRMPDAVPAHLQAIPDALGLLASLHLHRNRRPVADTIWRLFDATRAHVGLALRRAGEQVLANALHVAELSRQYERSGGLSFRGFVEELRKAAEDGDAAEAPIVEEGSDGVRIMTVHKAKGLEFPVVILADMTAKLASAEASRHVDADRQLCALRLAGWSPRDLILQQPIEQAREAEEGVRVAYVAATRARDLLVVPAIGDAPYDGGWVSPLDAAVYPSPASRRQHHSSPGCPPFRKDSVLERPGGEIAGSHTVCPGLHVFEAGQPSGHEVTWWDPAALSLDAEPPFGLRRHELISKDAPAGVVTAAHARYVSWRAGRDEAIAAGRIPSLRVRIATEQAAAASGTEPGRWPQTPIEVITVEGPPREQRGVRFGTLVHASLAAVPYDASAAVLEQIVATQGRILAAPSDEVSGAAAALGAVLRHPLITQARQAAIVHREMPVTLRVAADEVIEGVVDLAFVSGDEVVVVDFKTDRELDSALDVYTRQVQTYAAAVGEAMGKKARGILLRV